MQRITDPELYSRILEDPNRWFEAALVIGESGDLIDQEGDRILFGGTEINIGSQSPDNGIREDKIRSIGTRLHMFGNEPVIGKAVAGELDLVLQNVLGTIPEMEKIAVFARARTDELISEWVRQGSFYIDTRERTVDEDGIHIITIHGFDAMLMFEQDFEDADGRWPYGTDPETGEAIDALDTDAVLFIANKIGIRVDSRTWDIMTDEFRIPAPVGYSLRDVLGYIAGAYAGCFIITDANELRLVSITDLPAETNYLISNIGNVLVFGENISSSVSGQSVSFVADSVDTSVPGYVSIDNIELTMPYRQAGYAGATVYHSGSETENPETISVDWSLTAGTIYGGTWDLFSGVVVSMYDENGNPLLEPEEFQVATKSVLAVEGTNNVWTNDGSVSLTYAENYGVKILV